MISYSVQYLHSVTVYLLDIVVVIVDRQYTLSYYNYITVLIEFPHSNVVVMSTIYIYRQLT